MNAHGIDRRIPPLAPMDTQMDTPMGTAGALPQSPATSAVAVVESASRRPDLRKRRNYAPPRDSFFETAAMRREMYRL
ncbi:hypothetical protein [Mycolicibacterium gilvum]|uniref:hypothetical protein n=1 Tax=Mycolicibacterium gilvum TaxID=1804 RepID=UPI004045ECF7